MSTKPEQGPMTAHQLRKVLALADNRQNERAMESGTKGTGTYYRAWLYVTAHSLGLEHIPARGPFEPWEMEGITATINNIQDLVVLEDPA